MAREYSTKFLLPLSLTHRKYVNASSRLPASDKSIPMYASASVFLSPSVADDIHDQCDTPQNVGKDVHKDDDKSTIPLLVGLKKASEMRDFYKLEAINELSAMPLFVDDLIELVERICI